MKLQLHPKVSQTVENRALNIRFQKIVLYYPNEGLKIRWAKEYFQ